MPHFHRNVLTSKDFTHLTFQTTSSFSPACLWASVDFWFKRETGAWEVTWGQDCRILEQFAVWVVKLRIQCWWASIRQVKSSYCCSVSLYSSAVCQGYNAKIWNECLHLSERHILLSLWQSGTQVFVLCCALVVGAGQSSLYFNVPSDVWKVSTWIKLKHINKD